MKCKNKNFLFKVYSCWSFFRLWVHIIRNKQNKHSAFSKWSLSYWKYIFVVYSTNLYLIRFGFGKNYSSRRGRVVRRQINNVPACGKTFRPDFDDTSISRYNFIQWFRALMCRAWLLFNSQTGPGLLEPSSLIADHLTAGDLFQLS